MIRKIYIDFIRDKIAKRDFGWVMSRGWQYILLHASSVFRRPLCGPILGTLVTNYTCNYRCAMCDLRFRDKELKEKGLRELDTKQMKRILDDFARLGTPGIGFTGGEPLLRRDIFEMLSYTKTLGMISHLNTNGSLLNDAAVRNVLSANVDSINISLDGATARTHDAIRGVSGAFDKAVDAIGRLHAARKKADSQLRIKTVAVIQEQNIDDVEALTSLAEKLGVDCVEFIPRQSFLAGREQPGTGNAEFLRKAGMVSDYLRAYRSSRIKIENSSLHLKMFRRSFLGQDSPIQCRAGYNSLAVDCYGEIYPCIPWYNWRRTAGNIRDRDLISWWRSAEYDKVRKETAVCRKCYLNCQTELNILFSPFFTKVP